MISVGRFSKLLGYSVAVAMAMLISTAEAKVNKAVVRAVRGTADISTDKGSTWKPARVGSQLSPNSVIKTGVGSIVDLFLGDNGPVVRVTESTEMGIDRLDVEGTGVEKVIETQLDLKSGRILGNVKKLAEASKYEVKTPVGVAGIRGTEYDISANGRVSVITGIIQVVYVDVSDPANPVTTTVTVHEGETAYPPRGPGQQPVLVKTTTLPLNEQPMVADIKAIEGPGVIEITVPTTTGNTTGQTTTGTFDSTNTPIKPQSGPTPPNPGED